MHLLQATELGGNKEGRTGGITTSRTTGEVTFIRTAVMRTAGLTVVSGRDLDSTGTKEGGKTKVATNLPRIPLGLVVLNASS